MTDVVDFKVARRADTVSTWLFWIVTAVSAVLLVFPEPSVAWLLNPILILAVIAGIGCGIVVTVYQNQGNRLLRASQLTDALGGAIGEPLREDYYNSPTRKSMTRLASTTLENTLFTTTVLMKMLRNERIAAGVYLSLFILLLAYRGTSINWLVFLAQTLFSADVVLNWFRMERFRFRTSQVHEQLRQFFLQGGSAKKPNGMAIVLAAFTDYECAKDEAAMPLDTAIFSRINTPTSARWEEIKQALGIDRE
jgi:hypothetical protein